MQELIASLMDGSYQPQPVRGVEIPKPGGGVRQLGIPTVVDRLVQQAILQVLDPLLDPTFSSSSFGFRPGRGAHDALAQAREYVAEGRAIVVDMDLEKFFDRVNHDILMARLSRRVGGQTTAPDRASLPGSGADAGRRCVSRAGGNAARGATFAAAGESASGRSGQGTGTAWSPVLPLRGRLQHLCAVAGGGRTGNGVGEPVSGGCLHLRVNRDKSAVAYVEERKFLGHRLLRGGGLGIAPASLERARDRIRRITRRNRGISLERMIDEVNSFLTGWVTYFRHAACKTHLTELDGWIRRKLRCVRLKQCKRAKAIKDFLHRQGVRLRNAWRLALSGKGWWRWRTSPAGYSRP